MNIKKIIKEEIDDFDWVRDIQPIEPYPTSPTNDRRIEIGGRRGLPVCYVKLGDKVKFIPSEDPEEEYLSNEFIFTIEDYDGWGSWGSDMPEEVKYQDDTDEINHWNNYYLSHPEYGNVGDDMIFTKN